jgi:hypothetical protein
VSAERRIFTKRSFQIPAHSSRLRLTQSSVHSFFEEEAKIVIVTIIQIVNSSSDEDASSMLA